MSAQEKLIGALETWALSRRAMRASALTYPEIDLLNAIGDFDPESGLALPLDEAQAALEERLEALEESQVRLNARVDGYAEGRLAMCLDLEGLEDRLDEVVEEGLRGPQRDRRAMLAAAILPALIGADDLQANLLDDGPRLEALMAHAARMALALDTDLILEGEG